ncbi:hypothetical protein [Aquimarina intermedia]|uniref:YhhN-like protein n=1 Tax=Aquimarina intermedia TaxID=350814 RepID=A0A5S5BYZ6_9FLAO|nr:hypothetical protein [Aquimarina intermedia]TYP72277.1 hypothetical protein BD809_107162 [Aquimarina intermedia]
MRKKLQSLLYPLFLFLSLLTILAGVFSHDLVNYIKPITLLVLIGYYTIHVGKIDVFVIISILLILVTETYAHRNFLLFFEEITYLISLYYLVTTALLWKSLRKLKLTFKNVLSLQLVVTMSLILYLFYAVTNLILPKISLYQWHLLGVIISFTIFLGVSYYIYLNSKAVVSHAIMVAASCFLIVNILTTLNELYVYVEVFYLIIILLQLLGQFFLIRFFITQDQLQPNTDDFIF